MFRWKKLGKLFDPTTRADHAWMQEQAQNPYAVVLEKVVRVYFNCRPPRRPDGTNTSYAGYVDLDRRDLRTIVDVAREPVLRPGGLGEFDEFGVMAGSVIPWKDRWRCYYVGWTRMRSVPYNWAIGLAESTDGGKTFTRVGRGPVLGATNDEPYLQAGCTSIHLIDGVLHLWYTSGVGWLDDHGKSESAYRIMHATSTDGIHWERDGRAIINGVYGDEAQASPSVIRMGGRWHMVFSFRHAIDFRNRERGYRLGYAWSDDLRTWHRDDAQAGLAPSAVATDWDAEMICYPHITSIDGRTVLFYCGNDFGRQGFGAAVLEEAP